MAKAKIAGGPRRRWMIAGWVIGRPLNRGDLPGWGIRGPSPTREAARQIARKAKWGYGSYRIYEDAADRLARKRVGGRSY